jgi:glutamine synthetase
LPWKTDVAWFASDLWCQGKPFDACSRNILKRALARADTLGCGLNLGMEAEFFVLRDDPVLGFKPISDRKNLEKPAYEAANARQP